MKPKVIHLVDDSKLGGVNLALQCLIDSRLKQSFDFELQHIQLTQPKWRRFNAAVLVIHGAMSWQKLLAIACLKLANPNSTLMYQEHHYCREFVRHNVAHPRRFKLMLKMGYLLVERVLCVSNQQANWIIEQGLASADKVAQVGQAKNVSELLKLKAAVKHQPLRLLAYGRLAKQKGFDLLIQAITQFSKEQVVLSIAGEGEERQALTALARDLPHVKFLGEVDNISALLLRADAVAIPSRWEPFGLTCMESIAAGRHLILSQVDGLGDQIEALQSGKQGFEVLKSLSVAELVVAIAKVLDNEHFGVNDLQRQATEQAWEVMLACWHTELTLAVSQASSKG